MRLLFDHGTLVLAEAPDARFDFVPGLVWDPRVALYRAPAFRYPEVVAALRERGLPCVDQVAPMASEPTRSWKALPLRPYQHAALLAWQLSGQRGLLVMPTGSGKTRVALAALASTRARTLCLVPTRALLEQWLRELAAARSDEVGCFGDGRKERSAITVATFESAFRHMGRLGADFELLVIDEVHHFGGSSRDEALEMCAAPFRLGLTATPPSDYALSRLSPLVGPVCYQLSVAELTGRWLANFDRILLRIALEPDERRIYERNREMFGEVSRRFWNLHPDASWQEFIVAGMKTAEGRSALRAWQHNRSLVAYTRGKDRAVGELLARHRDSKVLVFTADNHAAYAIARRHLVMPITCDTSRREREHALLAFRRGELRVLVSARVLNEGIDVPDADVAIIVGAALGEREYVQRVGRLLRPSPGKRATVYELVSIGTDEARRVAARRRGLVAAGAH